MPIALLLIVFFVAYIGWSGVIFIAVVAAVVGIICFAMAQNEKQLKRQKIDSAVAAYEKMLLDLVNEHLDALVRKRMVCVSQDSYGIVHSEKWQKEVQYFIDKVVLPRLSYDERQYISDAELNGAAYNFVENLVRNQQCKIEASRLKRPNIAKLSPIEYEYYCADVLSRRGWKCEITKASGDQGVDVIARKGKKYLVIQCKKYSSAVGNGAVQEIIAAKAHLRATHAAVVTNSTYTRSAKELANSTGVLLLHDSALDSIDKLTA